MAYTASKLLEIARGELGYKEKETNSQLDNPTANAGDGNWTKYARDLHSAGYYQSAKNGYAWCDMFVDWCFLQLAGKDKTKGEWLECQTGLYGAGCKWSSDCYRRAGRFDKNPKPGDQIFFGKTDAEEHTGIVEKIEGGKVHTIEGNASNMVKRCSYLLTSSNIVGYGHPRFDVDENSIHAAPDSNTTPSQSAEKLVVDGKWGKATTMRLQQIFGTTVDGIVSNQWASYQSSNPGLCAGFDWRTKPNGNGSQLIKAMQKWAGMPTTEWDGEIGPQTIRAFQTKLGTPVDGKVSYPSAMVKALQKWANKQK